MFNLHTHKHTKTVLFKKIVAADPVRPPPRASTISEIDFIAIIK